MLNMWAHFLVQAEEPDMCATNPLSYSTLYNPGGNKYDPLQYTTSGKPSALPGPNKKKITA